MKTNKTSRKAGFTLVEIMIVVAIIGLLAAIAIPNFVRSRSTAQMNTCINNLRQVDGAKQEWALEKGKTGTDTPVIADIGPYLGRAGSVLGAGIACPLNVAGGFGGSYTINACSIAPLCAVGGLAGSKYDAAYPHTLPN